VLLNEESDKTLSHLPFKMLSSAGKGRLWKDSRTF